MNTIVNKPKVSLWIKLMIFIIPLAIFGYLIAVNFIIDQEFNYFYDIGGEEDNSRPYLTPLNRTSEFYAEMGTTYREINNRLIYFNIPFTEGLEDLTLNMKFLTNLNSSISLGIKNDTGWNYYWTPLNIYPVEDNWFISGQAISLENVYIENDKLNMVLDIHKLSTRNETTIFYIDWINITVHKPGVWK